MKAIPHFFLLTILLFPFALQAQGIRISGKISDDKGRPLAFASVALKGSFDGTSCDTQGQYSFTTEKKGKALLVASFIGYESISVELDIADGDVQIDLILPQASTTLEEVVISAGTYEASDTKSRVVLRSYDIGTTAGATGDITRAIETLPGVQFVGESNGLFVRGGAGSESQVRIDGMIIQNPYYSPVPDIKQRGRFDPFLFSGTIFSTGAYSAQYGQALSSVLALQSMGLADSTNTGGGIHAYGLNAHHSQRWENSSVYLKGEYNNYRPYTRTFPQLTDWAKAPENLAGTLVFRHRFSETDMLKVYLNGANTHMAMRYQNPDSASHYSRFEVENDNLLLNTSYKKYFRDEAWSLFAGASWSSDYDDAALDDSDLSEKEALGQARLVLEGELKPWLNVLAGGEFHLKHIRGEQSFAGAEVISAEGLIDEQLSAGFLEGEWKWSRHLAGRAGIRYEHSAFLQKQSLAPRLSLAFRTGSRGQVSLAWGRFFQSPEHSYLYYQDSLAFETATHLVANYTLQLEKRMFRLELYDKRYQDLLSFRPVADPVFSNEGDGYARGVDLFWRDRQSIPGGDYWISLSLLDTERHYHDYPLAAQPEFASKCNISVVYKHWLPGPQLNIGWTYQYASGRPYYNPDRPADEFHSDLTPPIHNLSINATKVFRMFGRRTVIYSSLENILGAEHIYGYHYLPGELGRLPIRPAAVRSFFIGIFISTY